MTFELVEPTERLANIRVAGIGGAGGNAINRMIESGLTGVDFIAINTDLQALRLSEAENAMQVGRATTRGLGSGGDPDVGRRAVDEDEELVREALEGSDMVFVTAGMGGGTGTGAAPVVARIAREMGALTVGIVTKPFRFEGRVRMRQAEEGLAELRTAVDTLIVIPNERLLEVVPSDMSMSDAFSYADTVLCEATRSIHDIIMKPHQVNLDFADVRSVMQGMGVAIMGTGKATGDDRAERAARQAISSPLLEDVDIRGAKGVLVNLTSADVGLQETNTVMSLVQDAAGDQAHIIFGYGIDEALGDKLQVSVIATGFDHGGSYEAVPRPAPRRRPAAATVATDERTSPADVEVSDAPEPADAPEPLRAMEAAAGEVDSPASPPRFTFVAPVESAPPEEDEPPQFEGQVVEMPRIRGLDADRLPSPASGRRGGFVSDELLRDLSEPAYTRKYLD